MSLLLKQRDSLVARKKEISANISIISKICPLPGDLSRQIFKEDALEKPTQQFFIHLTYYLASVIDPQKVTSFSWPLYDTKAEKTYRSQLATFLTEYYKTGEITPVVSSYFVNPGCFKIVKLLSQMSWLAVRQVLMLKIKTEQKKSLLREATEKYNNGSSDFMEFFEKETLLMMNKFTKFLHKKVIMEKNAEKLRVQITKNEAKLKDIHAKGIINTLVHNFTKQNELGEEAKSRIESIKDLQCPASIFEEGLENVDRTVANLKNKWKSNMSNFVEASKLCQETAQALILRHTGEMDKKLYVVEYNHETDEIPTKDLEQHVNSQQKYVLKNIVKEERLIFPNLVRGYVISVCYMLRNAELDDISHINEFLECKQRNFSEITDSFKALLERIYDAENKLQPSPLLNYSTLLKEIEIPPMPDLSSLWTIRDRQTFITDSFTPLGTSKHQFNLNRRPVTTYKAQPKSLITPFHPPRDDYMKTLMSCRVTNFQKTKSSLNISAIPHVSRANETIAGCSAGFTKEQIQRLFSTKKTSSSKKHKFNKERPRQVKKASLFNETADQSIMFRSHSSPNLFEKKEKRSLERYTVIHDYPLLEVSGIATLEANSTCVTPQETPRQPEPVPTITIDVSPVECIKKFNNILKETEDLNRNYSPTIPVNLSDEVRTPTNVKQIKKTSSIEKIINRFKKVRTVAVTSPEEIRTIVEEKENNMNELNVDVFTANKILLPDLLSPSCSVLSKKVGHYDAVFDDGDDKKRIWKPRESLGKALGVDETFLDQFDLTD